MIVVTGANGFIGSNLIKTLNLKGITDIWAVDLGGWHNLADLQFQEYLSPPQFLSIKDEEIKTIFHLGGITDTTSEDSATFQANYMFSTQMIVKYFRTGTRFIYASSAATYGDGKQGFVDNEEQIHKLIPLNAYAFWKKRFDIFMRDRIRFTNSVGLKYFNVYGPRESHKAKMCSMIAQSFQQMESGGRIKLFSDGTQMRDWIYIDDAVDITISCMTNTIKGIVNVGTGQAESFNNMASFIGLVEYINMPYDIATKYQSFTQADITKLRTIYKKDFTTLQSGISKYKQFISSSPGRIIDAYV